MPVEGEVMPDHNRRGLLALLGAGVALPAFGAPATSDLPLEDVIARHVAALGGASALRGIHSKAVDLQIVEKGQVIAARYRCNKAPAFRIDIYDKGKHVFCEGLDGKGPWIWPGDAPAARQGVPDAKRTGIEGVEFNLYGLNAFPGMGNKIALDGREIIEGVNYHVLRVDLKDSYRTFLYIDPDNWMIARRRDFRANHPDLDTTKQRLETQYSDFRAVNGIRSAFLQHQVDLSNGRITQVQIVDRVEYDPKSGGEVFDRAKKLN
jgi:hypothetical protein